jgi:dihydrofolate reductase
MDESGAMLWGRITYEIMESYWPAAARGNAEALPAMLEWAVKLEAKPKYVVSSTRNDFHWPTAATSWATFAPAYRSSRTRLRMACSSVAVSSRPNWTGWI